MSKAVIKVVRIFLVGHLLPVTLFAFAVFTASVVVTACSPSRGSSLKDGAPSDAQTNLKSNPAPAVAQTDLQKKLSGTWDCTDPKNANVPCFGQTLLFSNSLDKLEMNTFITIDDSPTDKCHVVIDYTLTTAADDHGQITLNLGTATLGSLIKDPSNADACEDDLKDSAIPNLDRHQLLAHSDDWKQITFDGVTYSKPDPSQAAAKAEAWPNP
jgi:hypothetical protein